MSDLGLWEWSSLGDLGRPSVLPPSERKVPAAREAEWREAGEEGRVGPVPAPSRRDQGVECGHSTEEAPALGADGKVPWSTEDGAEKATRNDLLRAGAERPAILPVRPERPPREEKGGSPSSEAGRRRGPNEPKPPR